MHRSTILYRNNAGDIVFSHSNLVTPHIVVPQINFTGAKTWSVSQCMYRPIGGISTHASIEKLCSYWSNDILWKLFITILSYTKYLFQKNKYRDWINCTVYCILYCIISSLGCLLSCCLQYIIVLKLFFLRFILLKNAFI